MLMQSDSVKFCLTMDIVNVNVDIIVIVIIVKFK